jgi:hypothetical protein
MIPDLLWRCPLCATNDALRHHLRWLRPDTVTCQACGARWRVRRAVGDNYYLRIIHPGNQRSEHSLGDERSITAWYDVMKQTLNLVPVPKPLNLLEPMEELFLFSGKTAAFNETQPRVIKQTHKNGSRSSGDLGSLNNDLPGGQLIGLGELFLTNQRILWRQLPGNSEPSPAAEDIKQIIFPLSKVTLVYALLNLGLAVVLGMDQYVFRFINESPLKWVTYVALLAPQVQHTSGHRIQTSHY